MRSGGERRGGLERKIRGISDAYRDASAYTKGVKPFELPMRTGSLLKPVLALSLRLR